MLNKIILLVAILGGLAVLWRWMDRKAEAKRAEDKRPKTRVDAPDLEPCAVCGTYVAAGAPACDRADCPRG